MRGLRGGLFFFALIMAPVLARADDAPTFYVDQATGCRVGFFVADLDPTVHWNGSCRAGMADGPGVAEWQKNGAFFARIEGVFRAGLAEGRGIRTFSNRRQEAEFRGGRMNGHCVVTTKAGLHIDTQCVNDEFNGTSTITYPDGSRYEGELRDSHLSGKGIYRFPDGQVYEGEWANDRPDGRGTLHGFTHGLLGTFTHDFTGTWVDGCFRQHPYTANLFKSAADCGFD